MVQDGYLLTVTPFVSYPSQVKDYVLDLKMESDYADNPFSSSTQITVSVLACEITAFNTDDGTPIAAIIYAVGGDRVDIPIEAFIQTPLCEYGHTYSMTLVGGDPVPINVSEANGIISYETDSFDLISTETIQLDVVLDNTAASTSSTTFSVTTLDCRFDFNPTSLSISASVLGSASSTSISVENYNEADCGSLGITAEMGDGSDFESFLTFSSNTLTVTPLIEHIPKIGSYTVKVIAQNPTHASVYEELLITVEITPCVLESYQFDIETTQSPIEYIMGNVKQTIVLPAII